MNRIITLILFISFLGITSPVEGEVIPIVPLPREYKNLPGKCAIFSSKYFVIKECLIDKPISNVLSEIEILAKAESAFPSSKVIKIHLIIPSSSEIIKVCRDNNIEPDTVMGDEGYLLKILSEGIYISANTTKGIFYGLQSLKQLLIAEKTRKYLNCLWVKDYPAFKYRGVMDDISRGPVPTVEYVKYQIRRLAEMKINMFMHYTEHVVKTKSHPEFAPENGNVTIDEYKKLSEFAKNYNVMFVGNFQSFGHFNNILEVQKYSGLGESGTLLSPVKNESYSFLKDIYSEMIVAFDQAFFHVNCDETFDLGKGASKKLVDSLGYENVYLQHVLKLRNILSQENVRMMLWGDVFLQYPKILSQLPDDVIICTWNYDSLKTFEGQIKPFSDPKHDFFVSPGVVNSNRLFPDYTTSLKNIDRFCNDGFINGASGVLLTVWDDGGSALFGNDWYGVSYSADKSWNPLADNFNVRYNRAIHSGGKDGISEIINKVSSIGALVPTYSMNDKVFWEKIYSDETVQHKINADGWDKVKKIASLIENQISKIPAGRYEEELKTIQYVNHLYLLLASERLELIRFSKLYKEAISSDKKLMQRSKLEKLHLCVESLLSNTKLLRKEFEKVWYNESQGYSFDKIDTVYSSKILSYTKLVKSVDSSIKLSEKKSNLPSAIEIGLDVKPITGKYFLEWLIVNPFKSKNALDGLNSNYLAELGEEGKVSPVVTQEFYYNNEKHRWKRFISNESDLINLNEAFANQAKNMVSYSFANIDSDSGRVTEVILKTNCLVVVFLNGEKELILTEPTNEEVSLELHLQKGRNNLLLKYIQLADDWSFSFNIKNQMIVNQKNRYKIL